MYLPGGRVFLARPAPTTSCLRRRLLSLRPVVIAGCLAGPYLPVLPGLRDR